MINMFTDMKKKLEQAAVQIPNIVETTISQTKEIENISEELLGAKMSDEIVAKTLQEEIINKVVNMLKGAF
jgi:hypothetical protein|tara:strand:+ start:305 stop:517 length:213 start_codon:yes stop_codon:yes gene_type:complete